MEAWMNDISPFVRQVKILKSSSLSGEWIDYDYVFTYVEQGEADLWLDGVEYHVSEGDVFLMSPFIPHIIRTTTTVPLIQYIFHFDLYYDEERSKRKEIGYNKHEHKKWDFEKNAFNPIHPISSVNRADRIQLKNRFLMMHRAFLDNHDGNALLLKAICMEYLFLFIKNQPNIKSDKSKMSKGWVSIEKAVNCIHEQYWNSQLNNELISKHVNLSTNHLSYLFKDQLNVSIRQYITHVRIEIAKKKIIEGKETMTTIAEQTGFSSIHMFSRSFKNTVGITPSQFQATQSRSRGNGQ
ncbi:helix-turn-helix domain-containing protein [Paenibacillus chungangensis]|uniref:Helix-turn-helix domain-containing protein n=1 Tax=Paenibacillus chungangensis TaxID=696535 RepID=A0ABW3HUZ3_9BACL